MEKKLNMLHVIRGYNTLEIMLRRSEPNVFGNYGAFGLTQVVPKYEKRWVTLHGTNFVRR